MSAIHYVTRVVKNNSRNPGDCHKIHKLFIISCFVLIIISVSKTVHSLAVAQITASFMEKTLQPTTLYNVCSVHREMFSTSRSVQYIGGYHEYIGGCSVHRRDIMSTSGDTMMHVGGYHEYTE